MDNATPTAPTGLDDDLLADLASVALVHSVHARLEDGASGLAELVRRLLTDGGLRTHRTGVGLVLAAADTTERVCDIAASLALAGQVLQLVPTPTVTFDALELAIDAICAGRWAAGIVVLVDPGDLALALLLRPRPFGDVRLARARPETDAPVVTTETHVARLARLLERTPPSGLLVGSSTRALRIAHHPTPTPGRDDVLPLLALQTEIDLAHESFLREVGGAHRQWLEDAEALLSRLEAAVGPAPAPPEAPSPTPPAPEPRPARRTGGRVVRQRLAAPAIGFAFAHLQPGIIANVLPGGDQELAESLVNALTPYGVRGVVTTRIDPRADLVVALHGMRPIDRLQDALDTIVEVHTVAKDAAAIFAGRRGIFVAVYDTGGAFGHDGCPGHRAALTGVNALARSLAADAPSLDVKTIDLERGARSNRALAHLVADELFHGGPETEVGLRAHGARSTLVPLHVQLAPGPQRTLRTLAFIDPDPALEPLLVELARPGAGLVLATSAPMRDEPLPLQRINDREALAEAIAIRSTNSPLAETDALQRADDILASRAVRALAHNLQRHHGFSVDILTIDPARPTLAAARLRTRFEDVGLIVHLHVRHAPLDLADVTRRLTTLQTLLLAAETPAIEVLGLIALHGADQPERALSDEVLGALLCADAQRRTGTTPRLLRASLSNGELPALLATRLADDLRLGAAEDLDVTWADDTADEPTPPRILTSILLEPGRDAFLTDLPKSIDLPLSLVLEWFVRLAYAACPDMRLVCLDDLFAHDGADLTPWPHATTRLTLDAQVTRLDEEATVRLRLRDASSAICAEATARMNRTGEAPLPATPHVDPDALAPCAFRPEAWYGLHRFGPTHHVITRIERHGLDGLVASVEPGRQGRWTGSWWADPATLEGALQLACWRDEELDGALHRAVRIERYERFGPAPASGPVQAVLRVDTGRAHIDLHDEHGAPIASLHGVQTRRTHNP